MSKSILPVFSFPLGVWELHGLTIRSLIHFEFIFVYDVEECFNFIPLHITGQFSEKHLL